MSHHFLAPGFAVEGLQLLEFLLGKRLESSPFDVLVARHPADGSFAAQGAAASSIYDPFEHSHVFAEAGPHEPAVGIFAEPVHLKDARSFAERALHLDPMPEVVA